MARVWHIYYGTRGAAGAYIDALQTALCHAGVSSRAFVSNKYTYNTNGIVRYFFPITDRTKKRNWCIKAIRGVELLIGYLFLVSVAAIARPRINLHLTDNLKVTYLFFRLCKLLGLEVWITCHDVGNTNEIKATRKKMFSMADRLVVHSNAARRALLEYLSGAAKRRIVQHPFPFSSYNEILSADGMNRAAETLRTAIGGDNVKFFLFYR